MREWRRGSTALVTIVTVKTILNLGMACKRMKTPFYMKSKKIHIILLDVSGKTWFLCRTEHRRENRPVYKKRRPSYKVRGPPMTGGLGGLQLPTFTNLQICEFIGANVCNFAAVPLICNNLNTFSNVFITVNNLLCPFIVSQSCTLATNQACRVIFPQAMAQSSAYQIHSYGDS